MCNKSDSIVCIIYILINGEETLNEFFMSASQRLVWLRFADFTLGSTFFEKCHRVMKSGLKPVVCVVYPHREIQSHLVCVQFLCQCKYEIVTLW